MTLMDEETRERHRRYCREWYHRNKERERERRRTYTKANRESETKKARAWFRANPEKTAAYDRKKHLKRTYRISVEDHAALFLRQGSKCGVCQSDSPNSKHGWSTDHCHKTGKVRGILCHHCNVALGHAKDDPATLRKLADYLESHAAPSS